MAALGSRAQELARVGLALFGMARRLEQGQRKPAAEALDFRARPFGLDQLPQRLRVGLPRGVQVPNKLADRGLVLFDIPTLW